MQNEEVNSLAGQLAERAVIRAEAVEAWVTLALEYENPGDWVDSLVSAAFVRLETVSESLTIKAEARRQLQDIRRAIQTRIAAAQALRKSRSVARRQHFDVGRTNDALG